MTKKPTVEDESSGPKPACFVIMPISDPDGYIKGHFKHVYDDILCPACDRAGFKAIRADQVKQSNLIHLDILQKLLDAPMALCDLSSRNPNVLFELALRQAFDKPVALVQEIGTAPVFDISPLRYAEYRKERTYHEVIEDQASIATAIKDTFEAHRDGKGVNSIVRLLALSKPAHLPDINAPEASADIQQLILAELSQLREEVRNSRREVIANRRAAREQLSTVYPMLTEMIREAEMRIMTASDMSELEHSHHMLRDCRHRWMRVADQIQELPPTDRERLADFDRRLDMLEHELGRAADKLSQKKKK